ncbi:hypothetical protein ERJ75_001771900 [Trypanosoma vivax]|nr:hypothetical protein ERJ75_001771900 [Trypanosoma vivax]
MRARVAPWPQEEKARRRAACPQQRDSAHGKPATSGKWQRTHGTHSTPRSRRVPGVARPDALRPHRASGAAPGAAAGRRWQLTSAARRVRTTRRLAVNGTERSATQDTDTSGPEATHRSEQSPEPQTTAQGTRTVRRLRSAAAEQDERQRTYTPDRRQRVE